jgi:hypothetical protein
MYIGLLFEKKKVKAILKKKNTIWKSIARLFLTTVASVILLATSIHFFGIDRLDRVNAFFILAGINTWIFSFLFTACSILFLRRYISFANILELCTRVNGELLSSVSICFCTILITARMIPEQFVDIYLAITSSILAILVIIFVIFSVRSHVYGVMVEFKTGSIYAVNLTVTLWVFALITSYFIYLALDSTFHSIYALLLFS